MNQAAKVKGPRRRHIPTRTCVACRRTGPKRDFVRIVRSAEGRVQVDETGKLAGRGAYVCRLPACWDALLNGKKDPLGHALKTDLAVSDREVLRAYTASLPRDPLKEGTEK